MILAFYDQYRCAKLGLFAKEKYRIVDALRMVGWPYSLGGLGAVVRVESCSTLMFLYSVMWSYSSIRKTKREYFFGFMMYASQKQLVVRVILVLDIFYVKKVCSISRLPLRSVCLMAVVVGGEVFFTSGNLAIFGMICFVSFCFFRETIAIPCVGLRERFLLSWG